jgi:hypothetical protein
MSHVRQQIRDQVVTALTGLPTTGNNVFKHRYYPVSSSNMPGLIIYTEDETQSYLTIGSDRTIEYDLTLRVEAYVKAVSNYDDTLDDIAKEIQNAISADRTLNGLVKDTRFNVFSSAGEVGGEQPAFMGRFEIKIIYHTKESDPETPE